MGERKWNLFIRGIKGKQDRLAWPKETVVLVKTFLKKVLSFTEDCADAMLFTALHRL
jgi:hypothetical protein